MEYDVFRKYYDRHLIYSVCSMIRRELGKRKRIRYVTSKQLFRIQESESYIAIVQYPYAEKIDGECGMMNGWIIVLHEERMKDRFKKEPRKSLPMSGGGEIRFRRYEGLEIDDGT